MVHGIAGGLQDELVSWTNTDDTPTQRLVRQAFAQQSGLGSLEDFQLSQLAGFAEDSTPTVDLRLIRAEMDRAISALADPGP